MDDSLNSNSDSFEPGATLLSEDELRSEHVDESTDDSTVDIDDEQTEVSRIVARNRFLRRRRALEMPDFDNHAYEDSLEPGENICPYVLRKINGSPESNSFVCIIIGLFFLFVIVEIVYITLVKYKIMN